MRWLILVVNVTQPQLRSNLHQVDLQRIVWITNWCWRAQPTVGSTIYRQVGLGRAETLTTQISVEEPASSIPPCLCFSSCLGSCPDFPQWRSTTCKSKMKHTPPTHTHLLLFMVFYRNKVNQAWTHHLVWALVWVQYVWMEDLFMTFHAPCQVTDTNNRCTLMESAQ